MLLCGQHRVRLSGRCGALVALATALFGGHAAAQSENSPPAEPPGRALQVQAPVAQMVEQRVIWRGRNGQTQTTSSLPRTLRGPGCNPVVNSLAAQFDTLDVGSEITAQAGMVELEGFAATYVVPDPNPLTPEINEAFPVTVNLVEVITATLAGLVGTDGSQIRMGWEISVYDGEPVAGNAPVFSVESDPDSSTTGLPPDILLDRVPGQLCAPCGVGGASVVKLQFSVDQTAAPGDQMLVVGNDSSGGVKTGRFTVAFRVTKMNNTIKDGSCQFGITHDCGPLKRCENAFMCTEANNTGSLNYPTRQWGIYRDCGPLACVGGTYRFSELGTTGGTNSACRPSRDVLMQVTYTPASCTIVTSGACCAAAGTCSITASNACSGTYQGNGIVCAPNPCPQPTLGACCISGSCSSLSESNCVAGGGVFQGANVACSGVSCPGASGACCVASIDLCFVLDPPTCTSVMGTYYGNGTTCNNDSTCPTGACCLANGNCTAAQSPLQCSQAGGTYKGNESTCATANCQPLSGACCFSTGFCSVISATNCATLTGSAANFRGGGTVCSPNPCPLPGVCCRGTTCATGLTQAACTSPGIGVGAFYATNGASGGCNAGNNSTTPCCYADFDKVNGVAIDDLFLYFNAYFTGSPWANVGGDGVAAPTIDDLFLYINAYFTGCQ